jgi:hypothetical protein
MTLMRIDDSSDQPRAPTDCWVLSAVMLRIELARDHVADDVSSLLVTVRSQLPLLFARLLFIFGIRFIGFGFSGLHGLIFFHVFCIGLQAR